MVIGNGRIGIAIEDGKLIDIVPYLAVIGMEDMSPVPVNMDSFHILCINVAGNVVPFFNDKNLLPTLFGLMGKYGTVKAGTNNEIIVHTVSST